MSSVKRVVCAGVARCQKGYVSVYLRGKDDREVQADNVFCGNTLPPDTASFNPRLLLIFSSEGALHAGRGFKAHFEFVTGTPSFLTLAT